MSPNFGVARLASRVLLISQVFPPERGGSARWLYELYRHAYTPVACAVGDQTHAESSLAVLTDTARPAPAAESFDRHARDDLGWSIVRMPMFGETGFLSLRGVRGHHAVVRAARRLHADRPLTAVHCGRCVPEGLAGAYLARRLGVPLTCFVHGEEVKLPTGDLSAGGVMTSRQHRWIARLALNSARRLIVNSESTARILRDDWGTAAERIVVVHPGCDTGRFRPVAGDGADDGASRPAGWVGRTVVLTVGRLQRRKGQDTMLHALPELVRRHPTLLYSITGRGPEEQRLRTLCDELGVGDHVEFVTDADDGQLLARYRHCDLFCLPNRQVGSDIEGFGMVLVEAQACGKPVLAGASGGTAETLRPGRTGLLIDCTTWQPLAAAVDGLLADPRRRRRMGAAARQWAVERFSWDGRGSTDAHLLDPPRPAP